ncbi:MAG TPA: YggS family pyridoxal phosphate-dependent enzyme [Steroidobacteraceae bacterium]|nr:YggS family pyridoxal phosphate-dependent enzyme [Steroidobacteraceae bacterium]
MLTGPQNLAANIEAVRRRIAAAALAAGRRPDSVTLVGVTKGHPVEVAVAARAAGLTDLGENYLQEALAKIAAVPRAGLRWHFIGQLQTNKTRAVAEHFDWVHTVDRLKLAERLSAQRPFHGPPLAVCLQVKLADEAAKGGVAPAELPALARAVAALPRLALRGLMCVPPESDDPATQRDFFARLRVLAEELGRDGLALDTLSMGMSADLEAAILEGATHVRIGTALFGPRSAHAAAG